MRIRSLLFAMTLAVGAVAHAESSEGLAIPHEKYTLPNGLEVILSVDKRLPLVSTNVWYHVGAYHETKGLSGFAHLFEHMMFQGSKHVGDDVHLGLVQQLGGTDVNGTTNYDRTNYFETLPSNHLETALWLESDRMGFLLDTLTEESLKNQQEVVKNERRQRTETAPYGFATEKHWQALFPAPHPYNGVVIGSMADLDAASVDDVKNFFKKWYAPANATLTVTGDFDKEQAKALIQKYFGTLNGGKKPEVPAVAMVKHDKPVVIRHDETVASLPRVAVSWLSPAVLKAGEAEADLLSSILSTGKSSRLHKRLVFEKKLAQSVVGYQQSLGSQGAFTVIAVARPGVTSDQLLTEIDAVLDEVRKDGVTAEELTRARNRFQTSAVSGLQSIGGFGGKADTLQHYNHYIADPGYLAKDLARYSAVTSDGIKAFVNTTLDPNKRIITHAVPVAAKAAAPAGAPAATPASATPSIQENVQ